MASKLPCVVPTCHDGGFGPWFELDWIGRPNHSMAACHVVLAERKLTTYVYAVDKYGNVLRKVGRYRRSRFAHKPDLSSTQKKELASTKHDQTKSHKSSTPNPPEQPSNKCLHYYKMRVDRNDDLLPDSRFAPAEPKEWISRSFACKSLDDTETTTDKAVCSFNGIIIDMRIKLRVCKGKINYYTGLLDRDQEINFLKSELRSLCLSSVVDLPASHIVSILRSKVKSLKFSLNEATEAKKQVLIDQEKSLEEKYEAKLNTFKANVKESNKIESCKGSSWVSCWLSALQMIGCSLALKTTSNSARWTLRLIPIRSLFYLTWRKKMKKMRKTIIMIKVIVTTHLT
ncbi:hypothetical protein TIFTF001_029770 [Ficus carica]|uniref:Uncharacterized protein n=1 Tax=Ficus carica TaxID=3494 RepID=A0AA88J1X7_FICCA|nr:hypothetical protein TIFTF001_029770 [Ficus carica]